jgi:hypothetical protein
MTSLLFCDTTQRNLCLFTDVSEQYMCSICKDQAVQEELLYCLTFEDGTDGFSRNVGKHQSALRNISEGRPSQRSGDLVCCVVNLRTLNTTKQHFHI